VDQLESSSTTRGAIVRDALESSRTTVRATFRRWLSSVGSHVSEGHPFCLCWVEPR